MSTIAKIEDGVVVDLRIPGEFTPAANEMWIDAPSWVRVGYLWVDSEWKKPDGSQPPDSEVQKTWEQLTLIENLSDEELLALEDICLPGHPARAIGVRIRAAMLGAVETYSRTARTKLFIGAAMQLGIVADLARAREILNDPGFSLE